MYNVKYYYLLFWRFKPTKVNKSGWNKTWILVLIVSSLLAAFCEWINLINRGITARKSLSKRFVDLIFLLLIFNYNVSMWYTSFRILVVFSMWPYYGWPYLGKSFCHCDIYFKLRVPNRHRTISSTLACSFIPSRLMQRSRSRRAFGRC